jgi:hypothetical protein
MIRIKTNVLQNLPLLQQRSLAESNAEHCGAMREEEGKSLCGTDETV